MLYVTYVSHARFPNDSSTYHSQISIIIFWKQHAKCKINNLFVKVHRNIPTFWNTTSRTKQTITHTTTSSPSKFQINDHYNNHAWMIRNLYYCIMKKQKYMSLLDDFLCLCLQDWVRYTSQIHTNTNGESLVFISGQTVPERNITSSSQLTYLFSSFFPLNNHLIWISA